MHFKFKNSSFDQTPPIVVAFEKKMEEQSSIINNLTLLPINSLDEYALGPSLIVTNNIEKFPLSLAEETLLFQKKINSNFQFKRNRPISIWPSPRKEYIPWPNRVQSMKGEEWKHMGIFELIQLSRLEFPINASLLAAVSYFWSSSLNAFVSDIELRLSHSMTWPPCLVFVIMEKKYIQPLLLILQVTMLWFLKAWPMDLSWLHIVKWRMKSLTQSMFPFY